LFRRLKWREVLSAKAVAGSLDKTKVGTGIAVPARHVCTLQQGPFVEVGAGVENILKVLSVRGVWRLRYNDHPGTRPFALRLNLFINF
jgi:hypothetical protein